MLFSNVSLDTEESLSKSDRVALLNKEASMVFNYLSIKEDKSFEVPKLIVNKFHPDLNIVRLENTQLALVKEYKKQDLFVILDSFRYKEYKKDGFISAPSLSGVEIKELYTCSDFYKTATWDTVIFKVDLRKDFYIFAIHDTLGQLKYLTISKGYLRINTPYSIGKYLEGLNQKIDLDAIDSWIRLK